MHEESWAINIDIEGFSNNYEESEERKSYAIWGLHQLMDAIINIGKNSYPEPPERIFAHQFGDGFLITSDFYEGTPERAIAVATTLMRYMLMQGYATKSAISTGSTSDIQGCYPEPIKNSDSGTIHIGAGIMTTIPVMGTALTRAHKLSSAKSGAQLILDSSKFETLPKLKYFKYGNDLLLIDWLTADIQLAKKIASQSGLNIGTEQELRKQLKSYTEIKPTPPNSWIESTFEVLG